MKEPSATTGPRSGSPRPIPKKRRALFKQGGLVSATLLLMALSGLAREQSHHQIGGVVSDQSGAPVPRVLIEVRSPSGPRAASVFSDDRGRFSLDLPDGNYFLEATFPGLAPISRYPLEVGPAAGPISLTLQVPAIAESIVVTATRTEAPAAQVGSSTTIILGSELEREGVASVTDALRRVAGITMTQSGGNGQISSLFMRGGESDYTKVMIDGIPVNDPGGSFNFANLPAAGIDRIEIVRGPQSALFGSDAMTGVIQIFTSRGASEGLEPKPSVALEGGSFATFRYQAGISGRGERLDYAASFARQDTDNHVLNGSFNDTTITGNLGFSPTRKSTLRTVFRGDAGRAGVPGQWAFYRPDSDQYYRHRSLAAGITYAYYATTFWTQTFSYTVSDSRQFSEDRIDSGSYVPHYRNLTSPYTFLDSPYQTPDQSRRQKIGYQSEFSLPRAHHLTVGMEYEKESGAVGDPRLDPLVAVRRNFGAYLQDEWSPSRSFFAAAGVRLEHNGSFAFSAGPRISLAWLAHQAPSGKLSGLTKIKANFGVGIKEPTLVESFSKSPFFMGNPKLRPERSLSYDIGMEQRLGTGGGVAEITYFENRFRNQINFITTDFATYAGTFFNLGKARARGIEASFRQPLPGKLEVAASYTFLDSLVLANSNVTDPVYAPGQPLIRRPRHSGYLDLKWKPGRWTLGATATVVGSRADSDFLGLGLTRNPAYGVLDLLASFRLFSGASIYAIVNNALDRSYMEVLGYPALPARFRIGMSAGF